MSGIVLPSRYNFGMEKFKYGAVVAFVVKDVIEITVDLGSYESMARAQLACSLHRESELFSHVFNYYHVLGIEHQISLFVCQKAEVE